MIMTVDKYNFFTRCRDLQCFISRHLLIFDGSPTLATVPEVGQP